MSDTREKVNDGYERGISTEDKYDVFIVYKPHTSDIDTAQHIASALEKRLISCIFDDENNDAFPAGEPIFQHIIKWIERSKKTLLILSTDSIEDSSLLLEAVLALHQSKKKDDLTLRVLLHGVDENKIEYLGRDFLGSVPRRKLDFNKDGWEEILEAYLNEDIKLPDILPVGSLAHGLVFSHFIGYYKYVLPELKKLLKGHDVYKNNRGRVSTRYYVLLPSTSKVVGSLKGHDEATDIKIEEEAKLEFGKDHAGKPRKYTITIYSIRKGLEKPYYFFADCPNVLNAIYTMSEEKLAKVDVKPQVAQFYYTLNEVIYHTNNEFCQHDPAELLPYNVEKESVESVLYEAVRRNLSGMDSVKQRSPQRLLSAIGPQPEKDVTILCHGECNNAVHHKNEIVQQLKRDNLDVAEDVVGGYELKLTEAKWYIFVITEKTINLNDHNAFKCLACLHNSITDDCINFLPVLVDVDPEEIPPIFKWATVVSTRDTHYCKTILQIVKGQPVRMQDKIPCGDIATGLAWAAYINYLSVTLAPGLRARIQELMKREKVKCSCIEKLFIIVSLSCKTEESLQEKANENCRMTVIKYIGKSTEVKKEMSGQDRIFFIHMYEYVDPKTNKSVCFMSEYCAAVNCIYEMNKLTFSGITKDDMRRQCKKFVHVMKDIMNRKTVRDKPVDISKLVEIVLYDDSKQTLLDAIKEQIIERDFDKIEPDEE